MKRILLVVACLLFVGASFGQSQGSKPAFKDRLVFGGDFALAFGNSTLIGLSPQVGYRITDKWIAGVGASYYYFSFNAPGYEKYSTSMYGGNLFTRYHIFDQLFVHTELQGINVEYYDIGPTSYELTRGWVPQWYVGGGYYARVGGSAYLGATILFDLIDDPRSPWQNPMIRVGGFVGI